MTNLEAADHAGIFTSHAYQEQIVDLGEIRMNYVTTGASDLPALLLIPAQTDSWWSYEEALPLLAGHFQVYAVDMRGQGRSTWTPGRYTLDNMGNDLVRFIDLIIGGPAIVSGNSSGGVLAAWLSAFATPGQVRGTVLEDAPVFASEVTPSCGQSIRQSLGPMFALWSKWLGDQWTIGDWKGMQAALPKETPPWMMTALMGMSIKTPDAVPPSFDEPPQNMREYDPEWGGPLRRHRHRQLRPRSHARQRASARTVHSSLPGDRPQYRDRHGRRLRPASRPGPGAGDPRRPAVQDHVVPRHGPLHARPGPPAVHQDSHQLVADDPSRPLTAAQPKIAALD